MDSQALETQDSVDMNTSVSQTTNKGAQVVFVSLKKQFTLIQQIQFLAKNVNTLQLEKHALNSVSPSPK